MPMSLLIRLDFSFSLEERNVENFQHYEDADVGLGLVALLVFYGETPRMVHAHIGKRRNPFDLFSW